MQSHSKRFPVLASRYWEAALVNVQILDGRLFAGFAYYDAGLGDQIAIAPPGRHSEPLIIWIPPKARNSLTHVLLTSSTDSIEFQIVTTHA